MYTSPRERLTSAIAALLMMVLVAYAIVFGLTVAPLQRAASGSLVSLSLDPPKPPPPVSRPPPPRHVEGRRAKHAASAANLRNQATQVVATKIIPLVLPTIVTAPRAGMGDAANQGASDRIGPGQGAGGNGNGIGGGGDGEGDGDFTPPRYLGGRFDYGDLPRDLREQGRSGQVDVQYTVGTDGRVRGCEITRSSGSSELDQSTCRLIEQRFRYAPSRDASDRPVSADVVGTHTWTYDRRQN